MASIGIDTANSSTSGAAVNVSSMVWSHTVAANPQQVLLLSLAWVSVGGQVFPTSVSRGAQAFTPTGNASTLNLGSGRHLWSQLYYITAPTVGAATVTILFNGTGVYGFGGTVTYWGVDQVTPFETPSVNFGTGTTATLTRNGAAPDVVVDVVAVDQAPTLTVGASQGAVWNIKSSTQMTGASSREATGGPTMTMTWSWTPSRAWNNFALTLRASLIEEVTASDSVGAGLDDTAVATIQVLASDAAGIAAAEFGYQTLPPVEGLPLHLTEASTLVITDFVGIKLTILDAATVEILSQATPITAADTLTVGVDDAAPALAAVPVDDTIELLLEDMASLSESALAVSDDVVVALDEAGRAAYPVAASDSLSLTGTEAAPTIETDFIQAVQVLAEDVCELPITEDVLTTGAMSVLDDGALDLETEAIDIFGFVPDYFESWSVTDECVVRVITFPGLPPSAVGPFSDSLRVGAVEAPDHMRALVVLDTPTLGTVEFADVPIETVLLFLSDSLRMGVSEVGTLSTQPFVQFDVTDSLRLAEDALLTLGVLGAGSGGAENVKLTLTETRPNVLDLGLKQVVDSCRWVLIEPEHVMQNPVGRETPALRTTEVLTAFIIGTVNKPVTETGRVLLDEVSLLSRSLAVQDNCALAAAEVTSLFTDVAVKTALDSLTVQVMEGAPSVPSFFAVSESARLVATEVITLPIPVTVGTRETVRLRHVDHTDNDPTVFSVLTASDSAAVRGADEAVLAKAMLVTDSTRVACTETASIFSSELYLTATDSLRAVAVETTSVAVLVVFTVTDSLRYIVVEDSPTAVIIFFDFNFLQVTDSLRLVASETAALEVVYDEKAATESLRVALTESVDTLRAFFATDSARVAGSEVASLFRDAVLLESIRYVVSEALLAAFITETTEDTVVTAASEAAALTAKVLTVTEALTGQTAEAPAIAVVLTVTDSAVLGQDDVALATLEVLTADAAAVQADEATAIQQQWNLTEEAALVAEEALANDFIAWEVADDVLVQLDAVLAELFVETQAEDEIRWFIDSEHLNQVTGGIIFITTLTEDTATLQAEETDTSQSTQGYFVDDACALVIEEFADYELGRLPEIFIYTPEGAVDEQAFPYSYDTDERMVW